MRRGDREQARTQVRRDERRSARLLFWPELRAKTLAPEAVERRDVAVAVASRRVPARISRALQARSLARGRLAYLETVAAPLAAARAGVLGDAAAGPPRVLVRVDLPSADGADAPLAAVRSLAAVLAEHRVPWLLAVAAPPPRTPMPGSVRELLLELRADAVSFGLRADAADGRRRGRRRLEQRLERAAAVLADEVAVRPRVAVPAGDALAAGAYEVLCRRFDVVAGGPRSVSGMGLHLAPLWRGDAVYAPAYPPLHGEAGPMLPVLDALEQRRWSLWTPVVLDASAAQGDSALPALAARLAALATSWDEFLDAVEASR